VVVALVVALVMGGFASTPSRAGERMRVEREQAIVEYEAGDLLPAEAEAFAMLADRGVTDVESLVHSGLPAWARRRGRLRFVVSSRVRISRTHDRVVYLPLERVRTRSAPYLHETVHALVPSRGNRTWLSEGLACYLESYVSETLGGYDAHVFSRAGNRGIHAAARRTLAGETGRAVLPWVGGYGDPPRMEEDRADVARPFYVLSHSLTKHLVESVGLEAVVSALVSGSADALVDATRRSAEDWKRDWLAVLG
jgi:hypothetical protein